MTDTHESCGVILHPDSASVTGPFLALAFRIGTAERQRENLEVSADVLDKIADDIDAVATEGGTGPPSSKGVEHHGRES